MDKINRIRVVLADKGISQTTLAKEMGVSRNAVSDMCRNKSQPSLKRLRNIAKILNVPVCDLIEPVKLDEQ